MPPVCEFLTQLVSPGRDLRGASKADYSPLVWEPGDAADGTHGSPQGAAGTEGL